MTRTLSVQFVLAVIAAAAFATCAGLGLACVLTGVVRDARRTGLFISVLAAYRDWVSLFRVAVGFAAAGSFPCRYPV